MQPSSSLFGVEGGMQFIYTWSILQCSRFSNIFSCTQIKQWEFSPRTQCSKLQPFLHNLTCTQRNSGILFVILNSFPAKNKLQNQLVGQCFSFPRVSSVNLPLEKDQRWPYVQTCQRVILLVFATLIFFSKFSILDLLEIEIHPHELY